MKNIAIIGGGTGTFTLLSGLRKFPSNNSVIVSSADDGGSTGRLRKDLGVFPPGDLRQCLLGLSYTEDVMKDLFSYRFEEGELKGHTVGNIIISALEKVSDTETAIKQTAKMLNVRGEVIPVTLFPTTLSAVYENGKKLVGEHNIDEVPVKDKGLKIKDLQLKSSGPGNKRALASLERADVIVFGPGDLYTSVLPNLLVKGVKEAIEKSSAQKVLVTNIMTKHGQTNGFKASDFVKVLNSYLGKSKIDTVIVNTKKPDKKWLLKYKSEKSEFVEPDSGNLANIGVKVIKEDLVSSNTFVKATGDVLKRSYLRHDAEKLAKIIWEL